ncbi:hypothetical protein AVEN_177818-1 [Araneus ventricosus]|uniref:Reverse transcriptase Ty1/copia-type domain-containing protein n=1 Tax=Araneus ventricosus TaxID=182803 RepID=A0A4Y2NA83_ARAVE|nr:hypothetical protein AVEN_177818-1 [Araneus ventricosus]
MHSNADTDNEDNAILPCSGQSSRTRTRKAPYYLNDFVLCNAKATGCAPEVEEYGLTSTNADPCIYYNCERGIIIGIYVDDLLIIGRIQEIENFKREIKKKFKAKDLGPTNLILSMKISRHDDGSITLDQTAYAAEILETFKTSEAKPATPPFDPNIPYDKVEDSR